MSMVALVPIVAASLAPDGSRAATVARDGAVRTWTNGAVLRAGRSSVHIGGGPVAVALSGDAVRVLWVAGEMLRLYERAPGTQPKRHALSAPATVRAVALSPSGGAAVVACDDETLRGIEVRTREFVWTLATGALPVRAVAMASDAGPVVAAFADGTVRRYDLGAGTSDIVGVGSPADAVVVTPGGEVSVTAAGSVLCRWDPRTGGPPKIRMLDTVITAVAVDATGNQVLVGADDGGLWLHDLTGGPSAGYIVPARATPGVPTREAARPPPSAPDRTRPPADSLVDDDVRFTVYRPQALSPGQWASLLVFAHKTNLVEEPGRAPLDPQEQVEARAREHFGGAPPRPVGGDARAELTRGARLRIVPDLPGIQCNPNDAEVDWWEPVHEVLFRLLAGPDLAGTVARGEVRVWCGPLIIGEVSISLRVAADGPAAEAPPTAESAGRYRKIFASYSHRDHAFVAWFAEAARAMGDQYLQDVRTLRAGERWNVRLLELIDDADVFQLFWSSNSMRSPHCREEWEHALALRRPMFVRPVYWEDPLPEDPGLELPPAGLRALHFVKVPVVEPALVGSLLDHPSARVRRPAGRKAGEAALTSPVGPTPGSPAAGQSQTLERAATPPAAGEGGRRPPGGGTRHGRTRWLSAAGGALAAAVVLVAGVIFYHGAPTAGPSSPAGGSRLSLPAGAAPTSGPSPSAATSGLSPSAGTSGLSSHAGGPPMAGHLGWTHLLPGDCLKGSNLHLNTGRRWPARFQVVPCGQEHTAEVYYSSNYWPAGQAYPGEPVKSRQATAKCTEVFRSYIGLGYSQSEFDETSISPGRAAWDAGGRQLICIAYKPTGRYPAGAPLYASIQGSAR